MKRTYLTQAIAGVALAGLMTTGGAALAGTSPHPAQDDTTTTTIGGKKPPAATETSTAGTTEESVTANTAASGTPTAPVPGAAPLAVVDVGATAPGIVINGEVTTAEQAVAEVGYVGMPVAAGASVVEQSMDVSALPASDGTPRASYIQEIVSSVVSPLTKEDVLARFQEAITATGTFEVTTGTSTDNEGVEYVSLEARSSTGGPTGMSTTRVEVGTSADLPGILVIRTEVQTTIEGAEVPPVPERVTPLVADAAAFGTAQGWTLTGWSYNTGLDTFLGNSVSSHGKLAWSTPATTEADVATIAEAIAAELGPEAEIDTTRPGFAYLTHGDDSWNVSYYEGDPVNVAMTHPEYQFDGVDVEINSGPAPTATTTAATGATVGSENGATTVPATTGDTVAMAPAGTPAGLVDIGATGPGLTDVGTPAPPDQAIAAFGMTGMLVASGSTSISNRVDYSTLAYGGDTPGYSATIEQVSTANTTLTKEEILARYQSAISTLGAYGFENATVSNEGTAQVSVLATPSDPDSTLPDYQVDVVDAEGQPGVVLIYVKATSSLEGELPPIAEAASGYLSAAQAVGDAQGGTLTRWQYEAGLNEYAGGRPYTSGHLDWRKPAAATDVAPIADAIVAGVGAAPSNRDDSDPELTLLQFEDGSSWSVGFHPDYVSIAWSASS